MEIMPALIIGALVSIALSISFCRRCHKGLTVRGYMFGFTICLIWPLALPYCILRGSPRCDKILIALGLKDD